MTEKISIKKIAELSGVSVATVSRVINDNGRFSEATRKRVMKVIETNNYQVNPMAKGLRMRTTKTIGIVVPDLTNSFFSELVEKLEQQFFDFDYSTVICDTANDSQKELNHLKMLAAKSVDGIVIISGISEIMDRSFLDKIPVVCIDRQPMSAGIFYIGSDHYAGAKLATEQLLAASTHPVLFMSGNSVSVMERVRGYRETMAENKLVVNDEMIKKIATIHESSIEARRVEIRRVLRDLMQTDAPICIFAVSDNLAADIIIAAHSLLLNIPGDLKIIGFDDAPIAQYCYPELTTIRQDVDQIATQTVKYLIAALSGDTQQLEKKQLIPVTLIQRGTL